MLCNPRLFSNIWHAKWTLTLYCNTGQAIVTKKGDLKVYDIVFYHADGITNILLLCYVQKNTK